MPTIFLLGAAIILSCSKSLLYRGVSDITNNKTGFWLVNTLSFGTACIIQLLITLFTGGIQLSSFTLLLSLPFTVFTLSSQYFYITAQKHGAVSLNTFIYSCGFILPTVYGILVLQEPFALTQGSGILVMLAAIYLYLLPGKQRSFKLFWLFCILGASFCSGTIGILQKILQAQEQDNPDKIFSLLTLLLLHLQEEKSEEKPGQPVVSGENTIIRKAQQYVQELVQEKLTVPVVAEAIDVSASYLTALFHKHLEFSPGEYIRRIKLQQSKQLIREGQMNFTEIAQALQYSTVHHFSRQFKQMFGITPTEYAKSVR